MTEQNIPAKEIPLRSFTKDEIEAHMNELRQEFDQVRLVNPTSTSIMIFNEEGKLEDSAHVCHDIWHKNHRCMNCSSARAVTTRKRQTKIEFINDDAYFVISQPIRVDGVICAMEIIVEMKHFLVSAFGQNIFRHKIESLNEKTYIDSLTGVYNRRYYDEIAGGLFANCVAFMDLDHFKSINDTYGHHIGDLVLQAVAKTISSNIRSTDGVIRYGGDEFLVFFVGLKDKNIFEKKMRSIQKQISEIRLEEVPDMKITVSIGAVYDFQMIWDTIDDADQQMYLAKTSGGFHIVFRD